MTAMTKAVVVVSLVAAVTYGCGTGGLVGDGACRESDFGSDLRRVSEDLVSTFVCKRHDLGVLGGSGLPCPYFSRAAEPLVCPPFDLMHKYPCPRSADDCGGLLVTTHDRLDSRMPVSSASRKTYVCEKQFHLFLFFSAPRSPSVRTVPQRPLFFVLVCVLRQPNS